MATLGIAPLCGWVFRGMVFSFLMACCLLFACGHPLIADEASKARILSRLNEIHDTTGVAPTIHQFRDLLSSPETALSSGERNDVRMVFARLQSPDVTVEQLVELWGVKQAAISAFRCNYRRTVESKNFAEQRKAASVDMLVSCRRVLTVAEYGRELDALAPPLTVAFDGEYERVFRIDRNGDKTGVVRWMTDYNQVFDTTSPLPAYYLTDSIVAFGEAHQELDLREHLKQFAYIVQEARESLGGYHDLIVLATLGWTFWIDPHTGMSVVRSEKAAFEFNRSSGRLEPSDGNVQVGEFSNFHDLGDGFFFPFRIVKTQSRNGVVDFKSVTELSHAELNPTIHDEQFAEIFPRGTSVTDETRGISYLAGERATISGLLDKHTPRQRQSFRVLLSIASLSVILLSVIWVFFSRRASNS